MAKKQLIGEIISNKMEKTLVVNVLIVKKDSKYQKRYKSHKKYKVHHDTTEEYQVGDNVIIEECRPISKEKKWKVVKKVEGR